MPGSTGTGRWAERPATSIFPEEYGSPTAPLPPPPPPLPPPPPASLPEEEDLEPEPEVVAEAPPAPPAPTLPEETPPEPPESPARAKHTPADARAAVSALGRRLRPRRSEGDGAEVPGGGVEAEADGLADGEPAGDGERAENGVAGPAAAVSALGRRLRPRRSEEDGAEVPGGGVEADGGPDADTAGLAAPLPDPGPAPAAPPEPAAARNRVAGPESRAPDDGELAAAAAAASVATATVQLPAEAPPSGPKPSGRRWWNTPIVEHEATASPGDDTVYETLPGGHNRRQRVRVTRGVHSRRLIRRIDVWTVFKVSLVFYVLLLLIVLVAGVAVWNVAQAFGLIHNIEKSIRSLFDLTSFKLHPLSVFAYTALGGAVLTIIGTLLNVVMALLYNLISDVVGGAQVVVVTEPE